MSGRDNPGFKHFFTTAHLSLPEIGIRGIGVREAMPPCLIERANGTGDYLLMLFHSPAAMACHPEPEPLQAPEKFMIWTPGQGQYYGNRDEGFQHSWIQCEGSRVARILRTAGLPLLRPFAAASGPLFIQCLLNIHSELISQARPDAAIMGNLLENALRGLARTGASPGKNNFLPEKLIAVRRLLGSAPSHPITLRQMAALAGMSVPHFCAQFKRHFGLPPIGCLIQHRMQNAAHLLGNPQLSVEEVGDMVGYEDPFHFSKMFKRHFGLSPENSYQDRKIATLAA